MGAGSFTYQIQVVRPRKSLDRLFFLVDAKRLQSFYNIYCSSFFVCKCNGKTITKNDRSSCFVCSISVFEKSKRVAVAVILDLVLVWALFESRQ